MKLTVRNLGRIKEAAFDIRPLTVFVGENGTNKTWVAYALYGLMKRRSMRAGAPSYVPMNAAAALKRLRADNLAIAKEMAADKSGAVSITRDFSTYFQGKPLTLQIKGAGPFWQDLLRVPDAQPDLDVRLEVRQLEFRTEAPPVELETDQGAVGTTLRVSLGERWVIYPNYSKLVGWGSWERVLERAFQEWLAPFLGTAFVLPAERKALASAHDLLRDEFTEAVSQPVADYAEYLRRQRNLSAHGLARRRKGPFRKFAEMLEQQVVGGVVEFASEAEAVRFAFRPSNEVELPIHAASSLVRAMAGLDLYLKATAKPGDFLFIDEVEMNAHPDAQLALVELLAMLVNRGLHVVMTTHSPYVIEHLNNLMTAADVAPKKRAKLVPHFRLKSADAFLSADKVSAYGFTPAGEAVEVTDILDRESNEIDWRTFSRVTDELSNLYGRILDAKDQK